MLPLVLLSALVTTPAQAQEVLVPEFTPAVADDFTLAYMFYSLVIDELNQRNIAFVDGERLRSMAGADAENCADSLTCPSSLWTYYPDAPLALVGSVGLVDVGGPDESIEVRIAFFERDGFQSFKNVDRRLVPGQEADFAVALAKATGVLLERVSPQPQPEPEASPEPEPEPEPRAKRDKRRQSDPEPEPKEELYKSYYDVEEPGRRTREDTGEIGTRSREREPRERQPRERQPRERTASSSDHQLLRAQAFAGLVIGDVGRSYDARLSLMGSSELGRYEHDTFVSGVGSTLGLGLEVAPLPWLELGVRLGGVTGRKFLSTGYERWSHGGQSQAEVQEYAPAAALRGLVEPRVSFAPLAFGAFRPSLFGAFSMRRYDDFVVADLTTVDYPDRNGGWQFLPGGGLGLDYDLGSGRAVSLELGHAVRLGASEVHHVQQGLISDIPEIPDTASQSTTITVGFTQGFL
jgi:hypothetical protein